MGLGTRAAHEVLLYYSVYGLTLKCNRAIPGLDPLPDLPAADVEVWVEDGVPCPDPPGASSAEIGYVSPAVCHGEEPVLQVWKLAGGAYFRLRYWDGVEFVVDGKGTRIWARWIGKASLEEVTYYLLGPVAGFLLRLRGLTCLHASAIGVGGHALAFMGPRRAGKSTTGAAFAQMGYAVLTDDITALAESGESFGVLPASPRLCLWPDSVAALFGSPEALPRMIPEENSADPEWDKRRLDLTGPEYSLQSQPLPLGAIYLLGARDLGGPKVEAVVNGAALMALIANTYESHLLEKPVRAQEFEVLSRLLDKVAVRQVTPHPDPAYIPGMCELILEDYHALSRPPLLSQASG
jgi:hypothetical protein